MTKIKVSFRKTATFPNFDPVVTSEDGHSYIQDVKVEMRGEDSDRNWSSGGKNAKRKTIRTHRIGAKR